jgi:hypothetical protein
VVYKTIANVYKRNSKTNKRIGEASRFVQVYGILVKEDSYIFRNVALLISIVEIHIIEKPPSKITCFALHFCAFSFPNDLSFERLIPSTLPKG